MTSGLLRARLSRIGVKLDRSALSRVLVALLWAVILLIIAPAFALLRAQDFVATMGNRPTTAPEPADFGFVETANGNLHLEIPLGTVIQRPGGKPTTYRLVYDSAIWFPLSTNQFGTIWFPGWTIGGWQVVPVFSSLQNATSSFFANNCGGSYTAGGTNYNWTDFSGTSHYFPITTESGGCNISSGDALATDSSGYHMYVTNYAAAKVYAPDGTLVSFNYGGGSPNLIEDSNGNCISADTNGDCVPGGSTVTDTLGRALPAAIYQSGQPYTAATLSVPGSQGPITYSVTYATIPVNTAFGQSGVTECATNCTLTVIQSVTLPDGSQYSFLYDCYQAQNSACGSPAGQNAYYGELISATLPTANANGGTITYTYQPFMDSYGTYHRYLSSRASAGGTWSYLPWVISTCTSTQVGCQQALEVKKPSGDYTAYVFTLDNGAWPTQVTSYNSQGNLLSTINDTWDFSIGCPLQSCYGHSYIRKLTEAVTVPVPGSPGNVTKKTQFNYDSPQNGNMTGVEEWKYYSGTSPSFPSIPDRATYTLYGGNAPGQINRPLKITVCNNTGSDPDCSGGGSKVAQTLYTYDSYGSNGIANANGSQSHDDPNFGQGNILRGNVTQISHWVSGSTYLATQMTYDTTGQVTSVIDPKQNLTQYSYTDNFFTDGSVPAAPLSPAPPKPTNAYVTSVKLPTVGSVSLTYTYGYYFGSGKQAVTTDPNLQNIYSHFIDPLDRPTHTIDPIGWSMVRYPSAIETDSYDAVADSSPTTGDLHTTYTYNAWGQEQQEQVSTGVTTNYLYDGNDRLLQASVATYSDKYAYDALDRVISTTHADNQTAQTFYGTELGSLGLSTQQGSPSNYGYGYPVLSEDEAGNLKQVWVDAFGRTIEADEPVNGSAEPGEGEATVDGSEQTDQGAGATGTVTITGYEHRLHIDCCGYWYWDYDYGTVSVTVNGVAVDYYYCEGDDPSSVAAGLAQAANTSSTFPATATSSAGTLYLTAKGDGPQTDYSLSATSYTCDPYEFTGSFYTSTSGPTLTGGRNGGGTYDTGTVWVTVNGFQASASYGQGSTTASLAGALATVLNNSSSSPVRADQSGSALTLVAKSGGSSTNYSLSSGSSTSQPSLFSSPSFTVPVSGSTLTGGTDGGTTWVSTLYTYDALDDLTQVYQDPQTRTYTYDGLGRRTSMTTPESGTVTFSFTQAGGSLCAGNPGSVCVRTDARGITTTYSYDADNLLLQKSYSDGTPTVTNTYHQGGAAANALGRLTTMTDGSGSEVYTYDQDGRMTGLNKIVGGTSYPIQYTYNPGGELTQIKYPSGHVEDACYNTSGQMTAVAAGSGNSSCTTNVYASGYNYDSAGQMLGFNYGNGVTAGFGYSRTRPQMNMLSYASTTSVYFSVNYYYQADSTYCPAGRGAGNNGQINCVWDNVDSGRTVSYTYDPILRLSSALTAGSQTFPAWGLQWTYDRYGNRWSQSVWQTGSAPQSSLSFDVGTNRPSGYTYDFSGNMLTEPLAPNANYTYDAQNRMTAYQGNGGNAAYAYDGNDVRVGKNVQGVVTTVYIYSGGHDIAEYDNGALPNSPSREFIYDSSRLLATISGNTTTYHHADQLSVRLSTDGTTGSPTYGQVVGQQGHYPFGEAWYAQNTTTNKIFTTYQDDSETGLYYAMARYYDPRIGGFCSADPWEGNPNDPQSWNRYAYVENDPVNLTDPTGKSWLGKLFSILMDIFMVIGDILSGGALTPLTFGQFVSGLSAAGDYSIVIGLPEIAMTNAPGFAGDATDGPSGTSQNAQQPQQQSKPIYCNPGVMDAMGTAMAKYEKNPNMVSQGKVVSSEYGFPTRPQPGGGVSVGNDDPTKPGYNIGDQIQRGPANGFGIRANAGYSATFHTHPDGVSGLPSTPTTTVEGGPGDSASATASGKDIYVISNQGLSVAPGNGNRSGSNDRWIVQGGNVKDWLAKLQTQCNGPQ